MLNGSNTDKLTLTLIRGLPGSGKSSLAKQIIIDAENGSIHLEADMFFTDESGVYLFDPRLLKKAHAWCQDECKRALKNKISVVVSNTFVKHWEMAIYRELAMQFNAELIIKTCKSQYENIHNVPALTIGKMRQQWQN
jgi:predicted kinase